MPGMFLVKSLGGLYTTTLCPIAVRDIGIVLSHPHLAADVRPGLLVLSSLLCAGSLNVAGECGCPICADGSYGLRTWVQAGHCNASTSWTEHGCP